MAQAVRTGYKEIFERNEYANELSKDKLKNLVVELTGAAPDDGVVRSIVGTFNNLAAYAKFDGTALPAASPAKIEPTKEPARQEENGADGHSNSNSRLNLSYTINLNLPETSDVEVFNAIFRSLKEHLLTR